LLANYTQGGDQCAGLPISMDEAAIPQNNSDLEAEKARDAMSVIASH
jgi:hypothetical protein